MNMMVVMKKIMSNLIEQINRIKEMMVIQEAEKTKDEVFAEKRLKGAAKIVDNAKEKGGVSMLTYHHFEVKLSYYEKAAKGELNMIDAKKEYKELLDKLYKSTKGDMNIEQIAFQELVGKIEVLGELIIKENEKGA
jgi:hypothetical protein